MARFEVVSKYADAGLHLPVRATANSAGYDFEVAEDTVIHNYDYNYAELQAAYWDDDSDLRPPLTFNEMAALTKKTKAKPTLVPTGIKCKLDKDQYLELSVRSSCPLKSWLILANSVGIIDSDYYNNPDNEGEIFFQIINLSPIDIVLKKGDKIGQGIIKHYEIVEDDNATGARVGGFGSTSNDLETLIKQGVING